MTWTVKSLRGGGEHKTHYFFQAEEICLLSCRSAVWEANTLTGNLWVLFCFLLSSVAKCWLCHSPPKAAIQSLKPNWSLLYYVKTKPEKLTLESVAALQFLTSFCHNRREEEKINEVVTKWEIFMQLYIMKGKRRWGNRNTKYAQSLLRDSP